MRVRLTAMSPRTLQILAGAVVLVFAAALWFLLVSPKRSEAAEADAKVAEAKLRLADAQTAANRPSRAGAPVADLFRLSKAMPTSTDQPGLVLELARLADASGVTLKSITPGNPDAGVGGPAMIPLTVTVGGRYADVTDFLRRTRQLVSVRDGKIRTKGRLFAIQGVSIVESATKGFPHIDATVVLNAFVYDGPIVPPEVPEPATEDEESPTSGTSAAGSLR